MEEVRRPDPQSQGPWEFSFTFSPTSQSVYFTCLFNIYMNQGNIISQKQKTWLPLFKHLDKEGRNPSSGFGWLKKKNMQLLPCCQWFKTRLIGGTECDCHLAVVWEPP